MSMSARIFLNFDDYNYSVHYRYWSVKGMLQELNYLYNVLSDESFSKEKLDKYIIDNEFGVYIPGSFGCDYGQLFITKCSNGEIAYAFSFSEDKRVLMNVQKYLQYADSRGLYDENDVSDINALNSKLALCKNLRLMTEKEATALIDDFKGRADIYYAVYDRFDDIYDKIERLNKKQLSILKTELEDMLGKITVLTEQN